MTSISSIWGREEMLIKAGCRLPLAQQNILMFTIKLLHNAKKKKWNPENPVACNAEAAFLQDQWKAIVFRRVSSYCMHVGVWGCSLELSGFSWLRQGGRETHPPVKTLPPGRGGGVPGEGEPGLGSTWGGKRKRKARITLDLDSAEETELWPPPHGRRTVSWWESGMLYTTLGTSHMITEKSLPHPPCSPIPTSDWNVKCSGAEGRKTCQLCYVQIPSSQGTHRCRGLCEKISSGISTKGRGE